MGKSRQKQGMMGTSQAGTGEACPVSWLACDTGKVLRAFRSAGRVNTAEHEA